MLMTTSTGARLKKSGFVKMLREVFPFWDASRLSSFINTTCLAVSTVFDTFSTNSATQYQPFPSKFNRFMALFSGQLQNPDKRQLLCVRQYITHPS